jgi:hypothetical protein
MDQLLSMYTAVIQRIQFEDAMELLNGLSMIIHALSETDTAQRDAMNMLTMYPLALLQVSPLQALRLLSVIIEGCPSSGEDSVTHHLVVSKVLPTMLSLLEQQPLNVTDQLAEPMIQLLRSILLGLFDDAGVGKSYAHGVIQHILPVCSAMLSRGITSTCYVLRTIIIHTNGYRNLIELLRQAACMPMSITDDYLAMMTACIDYCEDKLPTELVQNGMNVAASTLTRGDATESEQRQAIIFMSRCEGGALKHELLVDCLIHRLPLSLLTEVSHLLCRLSPDGALEFFKVLLSSIPASLFTDSERSRLWEDAGKAIRESRARVRDVREVLGRVKEACERRRHV